MGMTKASVDLANGTYAVIDAELVFSPGTTTSKDLTTTAITPVAVTENTVIRISNPSAQLVYLAFGTSNINSTITASNSLDILPGSVECFRVPFGATHYSAMTASGTATIKTTVGTGS